MVGYEIEDEPHLGLAQGCAEVVERLLATQLRIELVVVADVVAVLAARRGTEGGRGVHIGDAEASEVIHQVGRLREGEAGGKLQTVSRDRNARQRGRGAGDGAFHS